MFQICARSKRAKEWKKNGPPAQWWVSEYWTPCMDEAAGAPLTNGGNERDGSAITGTGGAA